MANPVLCAVCRRNVASSTFCPACGANFCEKCWDTQIAHEPGRLGDTPHEKSDPEITKLLQGILTPATNPDTQKQLHLNDCDTTWLRYTKQFRQEPELLEYTRYAILMQDSFTSEWTERWPQLVSFIGQTGDGKSTVIKMLIESQKSSTGPSKSDFPTPVVGGVGTSIPTSADIHLYAEPESNFTAFPRIYADCEGLTGGERAPMASRAMEVDNLLGKVKKKVETHEDDTYYRRLREKSQGAKRRKLGFATDDESRKREYTVSQLYPRLLYTFSHAVVFVLANERTFESSGFIRLLDWAGTSIESSTNQSVLPHLIVVLNKSHALLKDEEFDIDKATAKLLSDADLSLAISPNISRHVQYWEDHGRKIRTANDLLMCYYSSFRVVRIPEKGRYMLMDRQVKKLRNEISSCCRSSHRRKRRARRDLNADELGECLLSGLDHFTHSLDIPFDFLAFSWSLNPIPLGFEGNILRLGLLIRHARPLFNGEEVFQHLSHMVASCIMLDYVRHRIKGTPSELLDHYRSVLDSVLDKFCDFWWPCSYETARGKRCVNTKEGHAKGHQDEKGKLIGNGDYQSTFIADSYRMTWHCQLQELLLHLEKLMKHRTPITLRDHQPNEEVQAAEQHLSMMNEFYHNLGGAKRFLCNSTCLSCLRDMPEHPLPCGHVVCSLCVRTFGEARSKTTFHLARCPLHNKNVWGRIVQISLKPHLAGVRVLSLDGGGVRGIIELQVLNEIEKELGGRIPIQDFFDLIVGTSTGGIIALGLGVQNWSVRDCISKFKSLCGDAFTEREFSGIPVFEQLATAHHRSKYKTAPFETALKDNFGHDLLFGGLSQPHHYARSVAVTTTTGIGSEPRILANYNRRKAENPEYTLERPERRTSELKVWEAARATSAAPPYFKSFCRKDSGTEFIDGAVYHNNPIKVADAERKYIWPDADILEPDIMLSIGTGKCTGHLAKQAQRQEQQSDSNRLAKWLPKVFKIVFSRITDVLDSERAWDRFFILKTASDSSRRYIRINPELNTVPPAIDVKDKLWSLEAEVKRSLGSMHQTVRDVADRLVASCFYFEKANVHLLDNRITGQIRCRFEDGTENLRDLGSCLRSFQRESFSPRFTVTEVHTESSLMDIIYIDLDTIQAMTNLAKFSVREPNIYISSSIAETTFGLLLRQGANSVPISGFPRHLGLEDELNISRQKSEREAIRRSESSRHVAPPDAPRTSIGSLRHSFSRFSLLRHSEDEQTRSNSAPTPMPAAWSNKEPPESPDDVAKWAKRLPDPPMAELDDTGVDIRGSGHGEWGLEP